MQILALAACSFSPNKAQRNADTLVRINEDDAKGLDPQSYSDLASLRIALEQFEGLTRFNGAGQPEAGLAQSWSQSGDGLDWTFNLRPGLKFPDGHPITAATFSASFKRLQDPKIASPHKALFEAIQQVQAQNPLTLIIRLAHPFPALPELMAHPAMAALPLHRPHWEKERPMQTSGAYRVKEWTLNDHLAFEANPAWHDGNPKIAHVIWKPISDSLVALRLFLAGGADTLGELPSTRLPTLRSGHPGELHVAPYAGAYYFAFNTRRPPFDDQRVRLALSLAVEREWIAQKLLATGVQPAWGIIPPGTTGIAAFRPHWAGWDRERRLAEAKKLLSEAGFSQRHPLDFEIRFNSDVDHRRVSVALAAMWRRLGINARLLNSEASLHFASLKRGDFALARSGWIGDLAVPENYLSVHESKSGPINYSGNDDPVFDEKLHVALGLSNAKQRADAMREAEARLISVSPILPLYFYVSKAMVAKRVAGWQDNLANVHPSRTLSFR